MGKYFSHSSSYIDEPCEIGDGVRIWHFCHIMEGCRIGDNCNIGQNVVIGRGVVLGRNVKVQNNITVYEGVTCEDDVFLGPSVVFTNVINPRSHISRKHEFKPTLVKRGASIGANATIVCGITLGEFSFVAAGSVVTKSIPAYALVKGNPAKQTGWMSESGYRLLFDEKGKAVCEGSGEVYILTNDFVSKEEIEK